MKELSSLHILIAEDNLDDLYLITESFKKHKTFSKISSARNGVDLIEFLHKNQDNLPHVILTDINMPKKDGLEALEEIFHNSDFCRIPVFIYSSTLNPVYEEKGKQFGAIGYLIKPFDLLDYDEIPYKIIYALQQKQQLNAEEGKSM
jgi:CheY-like chemotaxis protein